MDTTSHAIDFENKKLVFPSENYIERRIVESCLIDTKDNFNISAGHFKLNKILNKILLYNLEEKSKKTNQE